MDIASQLIPALILMIANLVGGDHKSEKYEACTALFGWTAIASLLLAFVLGGVCPVAKPYLLQISAFSMITAIFRDYERVLKLFMTRGKQK